MPKNNLESIRVKEGLNKTELGRRAGISAKVISETERSIRDPRKETKYNIINGLNKNYNPGKYQFEDVFPNHEP